MQPLMGADWDRTLLEVWNKIQADTAQQTCRQAQNNEEEPSLPSCTLHVSSLPPPGAVMHVCFAVNLSIRNATSILWTCIWHVDTM